MAVPAWRYVAAVPVPVRKYAAAAPGLRCAVAVLARPPLRESAALLAGSESPPDALRATVQRCFPLAVTGAERYEPARCSDSQEPDWRLPEERSVEVQSAHFLPAVLHRSGLPQAVRREQAEADWLPGYWREPLGLVARRWISPAMGAAVRRSPDAAVELLLKLSGAARQYAAAHWMERARLVLPLSSVPPKRWSLRWCVPRQRREPPRNFLSPVFPRRKCCSRPP